MRDKLLLNKFNKIIFYITLSCICYFCACNCFLIKQCRARLFHNVFYFQQVRNFDKFLAWNLKYSLDWFVWSIALRSRSIMFAVPTDMLVNFSTVRMNSKHFFLGCRLYEVFTQERKEGMRERERGSHVQQVWLLHQSLRMRGQAWETALSSSLGVRSPLRERESRRDSRAQKVTFLRFSRVPEATWSWEQNRGSHQG